MAIYNQFNYNHLPARDVIPYGERESYIVSLAEAKEHLRIGHNSDDTYISRLIKAAQLLCEHYAGQVFTDGNFILTCDTWEQTMEIPNISGVHEIDHIKYMNDATPSAQVTWPDTEYYLVKNISRQRIALKEDKDYPNLRNGLGNIEVKFIARPVWQLANHIDGNHNEVAIQAVLITIADMYENRQSVVVGRIASRIPKTSEYLLDSLRIQRI
ncbi:MAG: hypothetical protein CMC15_15275 [Flavobacteriaceae bacterium]|nr:hypothetical protein [Flavobacteriaceae bacterium]